MNLSYHDIEILKGGAWDTIMDPGSIKVGRVYKDRCGLKWEIRSIRLTAVGHPVYEGHLQYPQYGKSYADFDATGRRMNMGEERPDLSLLVEEV